MAIGPCRAGPWPDRAVPGRHAVVPARAAGPAVPWPCSCLASGPRAEFPCRAARWARQTHRAVPACGPPGNQHVKKITKSFADSFH